MVETLEIAPRFCGPPASGNGGYVAGWLAEQVGGAVEVTLRVPPPLARPLAVYRADGVTRLLDGEVCVAEARAREVAIPAPPPPCLDASHAAARRALAAPRHVFPTCFVCGPERAHGDGLRIFAGHVDGHDLVAAPWTPHASLAEPDARTGGALPDRFAWAALDCPGAFAAMGVGFERPVLLGRMTARIDAPVRVGETYRVVAWAIAREGRKHRTGSAVFDAADRVVGIADAVWIEPRPA